MRLKVLHAIVLVLLLTMAYVTVATAAARAQFLAMLALTTVGASEIVLFLRSMIVDRRFAKAALSHVLRGIGGLLYGFGMLRDVEPVRVVLGSLFFTIGLLTRDVVVSPSRRE